MHSIITKKVIGTKVLSYLQNLLQPIRGSISGTLYRALPHINKNHPQIGMGYGAMKQNFNFLT